MYIIYLENKSGDPSCYGPYISKEEAIRDLCSFLRIIVDKCGTYYDNSELPFIEGKGYYIVEKNCYEDEQSFIDNLLKKGWTHYEWDIHHFTIMELEKLTNF